MPHFAHFPRPAETDPYTYFDVIVYLNKASTFASGPGGYMLVPWEKVDIQRTMKQEALK